MSSIGALTLQSRIANVIDIHIGAKDVTNAEVIGVMEIIKLDLYNEMVEQLENEGE